MVSIIIQHCWADHQKANVKKTRIVTPNAIATKSAAALSMSYRRRWRARAIDRLLRTVSKLSFKSAINLLAARLAVDLEVIPGSP